jgi:TonB-linked SusC/RagA family outer membrane protein
MRLLITCAGMLLLVGTPGSLAAAIATSGMIPRAIRVALQAGPVLTTELQGGKQRAESTPPLDRTVTLALHRVPLQDALEEVARQADVRIAYSRRTVPLDRLVSARLDAVRVQVALTTLLRGTGVVPTVEPTGQILLVAEPQQLNGGPPQPAQGSIRGTVRTRTDGAPLTGVAVSVTGTRFAASTDADGRYVITGVPPGSHRLQARRLGYGSRDTSVVVREGEQTVVDFALSAAATQLERVVVTGYGATIRRDVTGAIASVTAEEFATQAAPTITLSTGLQGKAPGVQVVANSGLPGGGARVRIRGTGSITANSEPLYVIDGLPAEQGTSSQNPQDNPLMSVDPSEIESIEILKDASATAIYGARGANGVILITTKRGQRGENRVTVESSYGTQKISKTIPVLNAQEFMQLTNEARVNAGRSRLFTDEQIASAQTYDYPGMMLRTAGQTSQAVSLSGGDQRLRYLLSGNYAYQEGIEIGSDFKRYGGRLNVDSDMSNRFRVGTSLSLTRVARNAARVENGSLGNSANGIQAAMQFAPFAAPRDAAGNWVKTSPTTEPVPNPVANATEMTDLNTTSRLLGSAYAEYDITRSLRLRSTFGGNFQFDKIHWFAPRTVLDGGAGGRGWIFSGEDRDLTNENQITYRRTLGPGSLDVLGGVSVQTFYGESIRGDGGDFPTDATRVFNLGSGSLLVPASSSVGESALLSYLGRANYNIGGKYLFTLTGRYDGSSRFGANNKWAFFPSAAFAWRITDESFMRRQSVFSDLKLRLSYGQVGNQAVDSYQSLSSLSTQWYSFSGTEIPALAPGGTMPNPDLRWEQQTQFNVGVDAGFWNDRVTLSLDAYRSMTDDLLLSVPVPSTTGFGSQLRNIGSVRNVGVELSLSTVNLQRDRFTWRSTLNVAANRNKVLDLGTRLNAAGERVPLTEIILAPRTGNFFAPSGVYLLRVGEPIGTIYGFQVTGLWQQGETCNLTATAQCAPGEYKIVDVNGDGAIDGADRVILGHGDPKFYGGFSNSLTYGPFSLDAFMTFVSGNKIVNAGNAYGSLVIMQQNERKTALNRWTPQNTNTDVPRANNARARRLYSTFVEDGSYLRLQTLTLGYLLPARLLRGVDAARVFVTGQNVWIATDYTGFDPDVNSMGGDARFGGIDIGAYPRSRVWNVGASVTF